MSDAIERIKMKIIEASAELIEATVTDTIIPLGEALAVIDEELAKDSQECNSDLINKLAEDFYYIENGKIHPYTGNYGETDYDESVDLIECINNQPQVQQWIPCSERLPENQTERWWCTTEYLTCSKDGTIEVLCYCDGWNCSFLNADMGVWRGNEIKDVIAWMPLPSPYTENRKES